jgi:hypothetical protein
MAARQEIEILLKLKADLDQGLGQAIQGLRSIETETRRTADNSAAALKKLNDEWGHLGESALNLVGAGALLGGSFAIAEKAMEGLKEATIGNIESFVAFGHSLELLHTKIGVPLEFAAAWEQSARVTGVSAEDVAKSLAMMDTRLATGNKQALAAINELGISLEEIRASSPDEQVRLLADAFAHLEASGQKADVVIKELMGKGGLGMLPFLSKDAQELQARIAEINGPLEQQVEAAKRYEIAAALLSAHWEKIKRTLTEPLVGGLASFMEEIDKRGLGSALGKLTPGGGLGSAEGGKSPGTGPHAGEVPWPVFSDLPGGFSQDEWDKHVEEHQKAREKFFADELKADQKFVDQEAKIDADAAKMGEVDQEKIAKLLDDSRRHAMADWGKAQAEHDKERIKGAEQVAAEDIKQLKTEEAEFIRSAQEEDLRMKAAERLRVEIFRQHMADLDAIAHELQQLGKTFGGALGDAVGGAGGIMLALNAHTRQAAENMKLYGDEAMTTGQKVAAAIGVANAAAQSYSSGKASGDEFSAGEQGAGKGAAAGSAFGPYGALIGGIIGAFAGVVGYGDRPENIRAMEDIGRGWGIAISNGLADAIASTEARDHITRASAELLNLESIMKESGRDPGGFWGQIADLMDATKKGSVSAREGIAELGKAFNDLKTAAANGSLASEKAMIMMINRSRELGQSIPEIAAFVLGELKTVATALPTYFAGFTTGQGKNQVGPSAEVAAANAQILGASFQALAASEGVAKAAADLTTAFDTLMATMPKDMPVPKSVAEMGIMVDLLKNADFKKTAEASQAGAQTMKAIEDAGYTSQATTDAYQVGALDLQAQAVQLALDKGYTADQARIAGEEANLPMLAQLQHAQTMGANLTADAQKVLEQATKDGVLPLKSIADQSLEQLRQIAKNTGKGYDPNGDNTGNGNTGSPPPGRHRHDPAPPMALGGYVPAGHVGLATLHGPEYVLRPEQLAAIVRAGVANGGSFGGGVQVLNIHVAGTKVDEVVLQRTRTGFMRIAGNAVVR